MQEDKFIERSQIPDVQALSSAFNSLSETLRKSNEEYIKSISRNLNITLNGLSESIREACTFPAASITLPTADFFEAFSASINKELADLTNISSVLFQQLADIQHSSSKIRRSLVLSEETVVALQELTPLVQDEEQESFAEIVTPSKSQKLLSAENVKWLLGILIPMLFTLLLRALPDKNAEEANHLQEENNAIQQTNVELHQEDSELRQAEFELFQEFFEYIKENGIYLPAQVDTFPHDVQTLEDDLDAVLDVSDAVQAEPDPDGQENADDLQP